MTQLTLQVAMSECTNYRTLWAQEGFDPSGHVAKVDPNGLLSGTADLYGLQSRGVYGAARAASINDVNLKGCGITIPGNSIRVHPGAQQDRYTNGLLPLREGVSEVVGLEIYNHFFGTERAKALVSLPVSNAHFTGGEAVSGHGILLRPQPHRFLSLAVEGAWSPETVRAKLMEDNPELTYTTDVALVRDLVTKLAGQYSFLWVRRILLPSLELENLSTSMLQYDVSTLGFMSDHREVWCGNGLGARESVIRTASHVVGMLHHVGLNDGLVEETFRAEIGALSDIIRAEYRHSLLDAFGISHEQREILQLDANYTSLTSRTLDWVIGAGLRAASPDFFTSQTVTSHEFYDLPMDTCPLSLAIQVYGSEDAGKYPPDLVNEWRALLDILNVDERQVAEQLTVKMMTTFTDEWLDVLTGSMPEWVGGHHQMPVTESSGWNVKIPQLISKLQEAYPVKYKG